MTVGELLQILSKHPSHALVVDQDFEGVTIEMDRKYSERDLIDVREVQTIDGAQGIKLFFGETHHSSWHSTNF